MMHEDFERDFIQRYRVNENDSTMRMEFTENRTQYQMRAEHWGQRKLLLSEIYFLSRYSEPYDLVVYVGAASGQHIVYLAQLFPWCTFHLYDSQPFAKTLRDFARRRDRERVVIMERLFTDQDAINYGMNKNYTNKILFISDIRDANIDNDHPELEDREEYISSEMKMQKNWAIAMSPKQAIFKFRLRFNKRPEDQTEYFDGDVLYQPWVGLESAELRLVTDCKRQRLYNDYNFERIMVYHNMVRRNTELVGTMPHPNLYPYFDVQMEYDIWSLFLRRTKNITQVKSEYVLQLMYKASNRLTCYKDRVAKRFRNVFLREYHEQKLPNELVAETSSVSESPLVSDSDDEFEEEDIQLEEALASAYIDFILKSQEQQELGEQEQERPMIKVSPPKDASEDGWITVTHSSKKKSKAKMKCSKNKM
jgi:hypothetical protein